MTVDGAGTPPPAWYPDPSTRNEARYWDGAQWTGYVSNRGEVVLEASTVPAAPVVGAATVTPVATVAPVAPAAPVTHAGSVAPTTAVPTAPVPSSPARRRSVQGLATWLTLLLSLAVGISALSMFAFFNRISLANDMLDIAPGTASFSDVFSLQQRAEDADSYVGAAVIVSLLISIPILVLLIIWMWRIARNARDARRPLRFAPGWTIGGWFIPLAGLVIPLLVMQDLWRATDPQLPAGTPQAPRRRSALVGWWWAALLIGGVRFGVGSDADIDALRTSDTIAAIGCVFAMAAAVLLIVIVRTISQRQAEQAG